MYHSKLKMFMYSRSATCRVSNLIFLELLVSWVKKSIFSGPLGFEIERHSDQEALTV